MSRSSFELKSGPGLTTRFERKAIVSRGVGENVRRGGGILAEFKDRWSPERGSAKLEDLGYSSRYFLEELIVNNRGCAAGHSFLTRGRRTIPAWLA